MSAGRKVRGLSDEWAQHQLDLLELAEPWPGCPLEVHHGVDCPGDACRYAQDVPAAHGNETVTEQEPACRWAHGVMQELDARGLCPVCAADDDEGNQA